MAHSSPYSPKYIYSSTSDAFNMSSIGSSPSRELKAANTTFKGTSEFPGMHSFQAFQAHHDSSFHRGRRKRSLSPSRKAKISRIRKRRACFRCQILRLPVRRHSMIENLFEPNNNYFRSVMSNVHVRSVIPELQALSTQ